MRNDLTCPWCGGHLTIDPDAVVVQRFYHTYVLPGVSEYEERSRPAPVAFCSGCEFAIEIGKPITLPYPGEEGV